ncbi:MAG: hypothetical protein WC860_08520 [Candidatus Margulisiibacteriota bacterium]|jgi:hypothetical protein
MLTKLQLKINTAFTALAMPCLLNKVFLFFLMLFFFSATAAYALDLKIITDSETIPKNKISTANILESKKINSNPTPNYVLKNEISTLNVKENVLKRSKKDKDFLRQISFFNPEIELDGFFELKYSSKYYTTTENEQMMLTIQNDPAYKEMPKAAKYGPFNLDPLYNFNINAKFSDRLSTNWNVEQEPDFPSKYQISVKYDNTDVGYGNFSTKYNNGEFVKVNKSLQGFKIGSFGDNWEFLVAKGQERSDPQIYECQINDTKLILPNQTIIQGTVRVYVNDIPIEEIKNYTVDYENGIIYFKVPQIKANIIKVIYEYTSPVADFIPILSKKNFLGVQASWAQNPYSQEIIATDSAFELIPVTETLVNTTEKAVYLENFPLIFGSESIMFQGRLLKEGQDYLVKANEGKILFLINLTLNENLEIKYQYYKTKYGSETIQGNNTNGPYLLSRRNIVQSTVECKINEQMVKLGDDFQINENEGKIYFTLPQDKANIIDITYAYLESKRVTGNITDSPISLGVSYFEESSLAEQGKLIQTVVNEKPYLIAGNDIYLVNNPIAPSSSISVVINGQEISSKNYSLDNYFSKLTFNQSIDPSSDIKVSYVYQKSNLMETAFRGKTGYQSDDVPYKDGFDFNLPKRPVKFKGIYQITLYNSKYKDGFNLREGYEYWVNYDGNKGQGIEIYFLKRKPSNPASLLTEYPDDKTLIKVKYLYVPNLVVAQGTSVQNMLGVSGQIRPNKDWQIKTDLAWTKNNFSRPRKPGYFTTKGNNIDNYAYDLGNVNLVENSESVYVNDLKQQKDTVYYINYEQGKLNFRNFTPSTADNIRVEYQYYDTNSQIGEEKQAVSTLVQTNYKINNVTVYGDFKNVPKEFLPIGYLVDDKGYFYGGGANWQLNNNDNIKVDVHQKNYNLNTDSAAPDYFFKTLKVITEANVKLFDIDNRHELNYTKSDRDLSSSVTNNTQINNAEETLYQGSFAFGPDDFRTIIPLKGSKSDAIIQDQAQNQNHKIDVNYMAGIKTTYIPKIQFIEKFLISPYFYYTHDESVSQNIFNKKNDIFNYGFKTEIFPIKDLQTIFEYDEKKTDSELINEKIIPIKNQALGLYYKPNFWIDLGLNLNHAEKESPATEQYGRIEDSQNYNINKFLFKDFLKSFNSDFLTSISEYTTGIFSSRWNNVNRSDQNFKYQYRSSNQFYNLRDIEPIKGFKLIRLSYERLNSNTDDLVQTTTTSSNNTVVQNSKKEGELSINPQIPILNYFTYNIYMKDFKDYETKDTNLQGALYSELKQLPEFNRKQSFNFNFDFDKTPNLNFLNPKNNLFLGVEENYNLLIDETKNYLNQSPIDFIFKNSDLISYLYHANLSSKDLFGFNNKYLNRNDYYNRNDTEATKGSLYKLIGEVNDSLNYKISPSFTLSGQYKNNATNQWFSSIPNISKQNLPDNAENQLQIFNITRYSDLLYTPIELISLKTGLDYKTINQTETINKKDQSSAINQINSILGVIIRPIKYLDITCDYIIKNSYNCGQGNAIRSGVFYRSKIERNFYVDIECIGEYTTGLDLNTITQENSLLSNSKIQKWQVIDRKDLQVTGTLSVNVEIPIPEFKYIDKFIISGSGRIKVIQDYLYPNNSYNISGIVISGKLLF